MTDTPYWFPDPATTGGPSLADLACMEAHERDRAIELAIRDIGHTLEDVIDCILVNETHVLHRRELLDHKDHIRESLTTLCHTLNGAPS